MEAIKGFKTLLFNAIMTIGMLTTIWTGVDTSKEVVTVNDNFDTILTSLTTLWMIGNAWLRAVTDSAIFQKR